MLQELILQQPYDVICMIHVTSDLYDDCSQRVDHSRIPDNISLEHPVISESGPSVG